MRITPTSGLPPDEIERLIHDADASAEADRQTKEAVVLRNKLETLLRNTQKSFTKFGGLLSANDQQMAEGVFAESEAAISSGNLDVINLVLSKLERVASGLTMAMMKPENKDVTSEVGGKS